MAQRILVSIARVLGWPVIRLIEAVGRLAARRGGPLDVDPWERTRVPLSAPVSHLGIPSKDALRRYRTGESGVAVHSLDDVLAFLRDCEYQVSTQFRAEATDWGGLPFAFEYTRRGDCLDHSLWAWRKLAELGHRVELVVGWHAQGVATIITRPDAPRHAWLLLSTPTGERLLLEPATKDHARMLRPLHAVALDEYLPQFGVDAAGQTFMFEGAVLSTYAGFGGEVRVTRPTGAG